MTLKTQLTTLVVWILLIDAKASGPVEPSMGLESGVNVTVEEGQQAVLQCVVHNLGPHTVSWFGKGNPITIGYNIFLPKGSPVSIQHDENYWNLVLRHPTHDDSGTYTCQVSSLVPLQHNVYLHVKAKKSTGDLIPGRKEMDGPPDTKSRAREPAGATGSSDIAHEPRHNKKNTEPSSDERQSALLHALRMKAVQKEHEAQMSLIEQQRTYLRIEHEARMNGIKAKGRKRKRKRDQRNVHKTDSVIIQGKDAVDIGNDVEFLCRYMLEENWDAQGPALTWYKDGNQIFPFSAGATFLTIEEFRVSGGFTSKMSLAQARKEDAGTYICRTPSNTVATHQLHVLSGYTSNIKREQSAGGDGQLVNGASHLLSVFVLCAPLVLFVAS